MVDAARPVTPPVDRWMLPGELALAADPAGDPRSAGPAPRTARDWAVDVTAFVLAVVVGFSEFTLVVMPDLLQLPAWIRVTDPVLGGVACLAIWWRRRFPVVLATVGVLASSLSNTATGAVFVLLFTVALHRGWKWAVPLGLALVVLGVPYIVTYYSGALGPPAELLLYVALAAALVVATGLGVRARRQLVLAMRMRADAARREQEWQLAESRRTERERIAREMHDVLAHRISLLSVHAGALEYRTAMAENGTAPPPTAAEVHAAAGVVRSTAHQALEELRDVLHLLRHPEAPSVEDGAADPQPTADRLPLLVDEARRSGQVVHAELTGDLAALRPQLQRTIFRIVQEGLTNARKHAPGAEVDLVVRGTPEDGVVVQVATPTPVGVTSTEIPGAGAGLTGLAERAALHGGTLRHEIVDGRFRLLARLPWAP